MDAAYDASPWTDFSVAAAGASAALAGLVFVAISINVEHILRLAGVPDRSLATITLLVSVLLVSLLCLVPGQRERTLGIELLVVELMCGALILHLTRRSLVAAEEAGYDRLVTQSIVAGLGTIPVAIGALSLVAGTGGGLYWVAVGIVLATAGAVANAWVLMVEIRR